MMRTGDAGIALAPIYFKKGEESIIGFEFFASVINFAGARFLCTLSNNPETAIKIVLQNLKQWGVFAWFDTGEIFWNSKGETLWTE